MSLFDSFKKFPWFKFYGNMKKSIKVPDVSMYEMVRRSAKKYPELTAYSYFGTESKYEKYIKQIDKAAKAFVRLGVKKGDVVSIVMPNTPEAIICFYGLNKLGALINMIHPLSSEEEIKFAMKITNTKYALVADIVYNKLANVKKDLKLKKIIYTPLSLSMDPITKIGYKLKTFGKFPMVLSNDTIEYNEFIRRSKYEEKEIKDTGKGSDKAVILHSGGTSGKPKGIVLTNTNFNSVALGLLEGVEDMGPGVSTLSIMPIFHGFGLACTFHAVNITGGKQLYFQLLMLKNLMKQF